MAGGLDHSALTTLTNTDLLDGLMDATDQTIWRQYVDRYRPLIIAYARRLGAAAEDAEDIAQQTLVEFSTAYRQGRYDRERFRLRDWLFGIARNKALTWFRRGRGREVLVAGDTAAIRLFAERGDERATRDIWDEEWRDALLARCLDVVRAEVHATTYEAFELFVCRDWPADRVAEHLGITSNAVYGAKRRVCRRIRELEPIAAETW